MLQAYNLSKAGAGILLVLSLKEGHIIITKTQKGPQSYTSLHKAKAETKAYEVNHKAVQKTP